MAFQVFIQHGGAIGYGSPKSSLGAALGDAYDAWARFVRKHPRDFKPAEKPEVLLSVASGPVDPRKGGARLHTSAELAAMAVINAGERRVLIRVPGKLAPRTTYDITNVMLAVQDYKYGAVWGH